LIENFLPSVSWENVTELATNQNQYLREGKIIPTLHPFSFLIIVKPSIALWEIYSPNPLDPLNIYFNLDVDALPDPNENFFIQNS
jgi:hypothetical protein